MIGESVRQEAEQANREVHHRVPRYLLGIRDRAEAHAELDGEGVQLWSDWELEALRWGVDPDVSRDGLAALVEGSAAVIGREAHREIHAEDFVRWGRRGGLRTLTLYGAPWFSLLALRRWGKVGAETLAEHLAAMDRRS